jgi:Metallopeptidase family M24
VDRAEKGEFGTAYRIPCETSHASQPRSLNTTSAGYQVNTAFGGHGVGRVMHGPPDVPNDGVAGRGLTLRPGLVIAIEPWFLAGSPKIVIDRDGWTIRSVDGSRGVHVEHTVAVTADGPLVLTARDAVAASAPVRATAGPRPHTTESLQ